MSGLASSNSHTNHANGSGGVSELTETFLGKDVNEKGSNLSPVTKAVSIV